MDWQIFSLPIVAAVIGWGNECHRHPYALLAATYIRILGWEFLGVLPKRRLEIAQSIGEVLNDDLLPTDELLEAVNTPETRRRVAALITESLTEKIHRFVPRFIMEPRRTRSAITWRRQ